MYIVRADGNAKIGAGHLMRCLTIAEEMVKQSIDKKEIVFVCADEDSALLVQNYGFHAKVLGSNYQELIEELPKWVNLFTTKSEADEILHKSGDEETDGMVDKKTEVMGSHANTILVDSYYVTDEYLKCLQKYGKVLLMDDMQRHSFPVDGVINYNAFADAEIYYKLYKDTSTCCYVGSNYVPVRTQFLQRQYQVAKQVKNIMITTGGADKDNIAKSILQRIYRQDVSYHLIIGKYSPHREELEKWAEAHEGVHIYYDVKDMAGLMVNCDLAITAGGTTIYELAAIGVPFICFSYAENQEALTEYIGRKEVAGYAGAYHKDAEATLEMMQHLVQEFGNSKNKRENCYFKEKQLIDGLGAKRLAKVIIG